MPGTVTQPTIDDVARLAEHLPGAVRDMAFKIASDFAPDGAYVLTALTVIVVVLASIRTLLSQEGFVDTLSEVIRVVLIWGVAAWFLRDYPLIMTPLWDSFDAISNRIALVQAPAIGSASTYAPGQPGMAGLFKAVSSILSVLGMTWPGDYGGWHKVAYIVGALPQIFETTALSVLAAGALILAAGMYLVVFATSKCLLAVGLALGPLLIPWIVFEATRGFFESWIRFCVFAGLYQVVATILMMIVGPIIGYVDVWSQAVAASQTRFNGDVLVAGMAIMMLISMLIFVLLLQAPSIANALAGGGVRVFSRMSAPRGVDAGRVASTRPGFGGSPAASTASRSPGGSTRTGVAVSPSPGRGG